MGWALKMTKEKKKFEERVKSYLIDKFENRERSGNKADPISVSKEMKMKKDGDGKLYFKPSEWKSSQQIKGFFFSYSAKLRQTTVGEEVFTEENMEACEAEMIRQHLRDVVENDIQKPEHPIEAEQVNVGQLSKEGKLTSLKLSPLTSSPSKNYRDTYKKNILHRFP